MIKVRTSAMENGKYFFLVLIPIIIIFLVVTVILLNQAWLNTSWHAWFAGDRLCCYPVRLQSRNGKSTSESGFRNYRWTEPV